jgi:hypothetical protein
MTQPFFCSDRCVSDTFVEAAGENAVGVLAPYPWNPDRTDPKLVGFKSAFRERFGTSALAPSPIPTLPTPTTV